MSKHFCARQISPALAKIALEELNEVPERIEEDLNILRSWIAQQPHLKARTTDEFLIPFLRHSRYSLEETKKRIDNYFSFYNIFPEIMANRCINQRTFDINRIGVNYYPADPKCDNQRALLIARFGVYDSRIYQLREILQFNMMAMEMIAMESDNASIAGICQIIDLANATFDQMRQFDNIIFKKWCTFYRDCCPIKIKEVYIINIPKELQRLLAFMKSVMPSNLGFEVVMLKSVEELYDYIPKKCLPEEYGGYNGHIAECITYMEDLLRSYRDYFAEDANYGTREEQRTGDIIPYEAEFGVNGSFRKLSNVE